MDDSIEPKDARVESSVGRKQDGDDSNTDGPQDNSKGRKQSEQRPSSPGKGDSKPTDEVIRLQQVKPAEVGKHNAESLQKSENSSKGKGNSRNGNEPSVDQEQDGNNHITDSHDHSKGSKVSEGARIPEKGESKPTDEIIRQLGKHKLESVQKRENPSKGRTDSRKSTASKFMRRFKTFGVTVKKLWDVWGSFKTKNNQDPSPTLSDKTLGVPGYEEIACIEAEVPDIMMMDKDRVRTSCKECMKDPPAFPSKEQVKAKLIAADKYYGVNATKSKEPSDANLEHEADYYDVDGTVVRPSWRFILERPLVEQYVLMTNYIRKVSVLSELKEGKTATKFIEEEDTGSDTEYKKFEQKYIKQRRELLKPILKPKTQEMAVQTSFIPEQTHQEELKESVSEISLYPESEESTNSPEASAVTIVTSRDYSSPLQSDFDGRTTDKSASYREGNWWESQAHCQPSESFQTSCDSVNNNVSSGSDGQPVPVHAAWGRISLRPTENEGEWIVPSSHKSSVESTTKPKDSKRVSFSPVVTYYHGTNKNSAVYNLPEDHSVTDTDQVEREPNSTGETRSEGPMAEEPAVIEETQNPDMDKPRPPNKTLTNILQERKSDQIVSVTLPEGWHKDRVFHNKQKVTVAVSRTSTGNHQTTKKISFQESDEIPDVQYSNPQIVTVQEKTDSNIQTQMATQKSTASRVQATTPRRINPTTAQLVQINSTNSMHEREPDDGTSSPKRTRKTNCHDLKRNDGHVMESVGTNIQGAANYQVAQRRKPGAPSEVQSSVGPTKLSIIPNRFISNPPQKERNQSWWLYKYETPTNIPKYHQTMQQSTHSDVDLKNEPPDVQQRTLSDPSLSERPLHKSYTYEPHRKQQVSTDTEGSSTSNDHIKLKASPACIFKVATPTDLSKISVEDFYPDVPEIDAELSQNSESSMVSNPKVELVFDNKETALKCKQGTYESLKITRKEENTILQSSVGKGRTIMVSPGIEIKDLTKQKEPRIVSANKPPAMNDIQPRPVPKISSKKVKPISRESPIVPEQATRIDRALRREAMLEIGVKQILKVKEYRKPETPPLKDTNSNTVQSSSSAPQKLRTLKQQQMTNHEGRPNADKLGECSREQDKAEKNKKCERKLGHLENKVVAMMKDEQKIGKGEELNGMECAKPETDSENLEPIQHQFDNVIKNQENQLPLGRGKNFMTTLSSLTEETSSVMESTSSSTAEKLIDMPAMARSVEELKTIFEKKTEASNSIGPELAENQSHSKKCKGLTEGKFQGGGGAGIPKAAGVEQERASGQFRTQSNEKHPPKTDEQSSETGQNLTPTEKLDIIKTMAKRSVETQLRPASDNKNPSMLDEESSAQQLSQIDVIRPSEIYSNTSMYFSTSEDRVVKLSKARTTFEPMKDDDGCSSNGKEGACSKNLHLDGSMESKRSSSSPITTDVLVNEGKKEKQELDDKTKSSSYHGRDSKVGCHDQNITDREKGGTSDPPGNAADPTSTVVEQSPHEAAVSQMADTSVPSETKQWLMDVIPTFSKPTRIQGFRPQKPVCVKEAEGAMRNRQEAVKPVFKFLKWQREMDDNK